MKLKNSLKLLAQEKRLHQCPIPIIGLSGSIATGKSSACELMKGHGLKVISADQLIHEIYADKSTLDYISQVCPQAIKQEKIDFPTLRKEFFNDKSLKDKIENYLYAKLPTQFLSKIDQKDLVVIYDVPLLYEKDLAKSVDYHGIVYTSPDVQKKRLLSRDKIYDEETLQKVIQSQISIEEKKEKAQFVIDNNQGLDHLEQEVQNFIKETFSKE